MSSLIRNGAIPLVELIDEYTDWFAGDYAGKGEWNRVTGTYF